MKTFTQQWEKYLATVYPDQKLEDDQKKQLYLAFHAGALMMLSLVTDAADKPMDEAQKLILGLKDEVLENCKLYTDQVKQKN